MTLKTLLFALPLIVGPAVAFAQGCHGDRVDQQAMSCAEGTFWDSTASTCVPITLESS